MATNEVNSNADYQYDEVVGLLAKDANIAYAVYLRRQAGSLTSHIFLNTADFSSSLSSTYKIITDPYFTHTPTPLAFAGVALKPGSVDPEGYWFGSSIAGKSFKTAP